MAKETKLHIDTSELAEALGSLSDATLDLLADKLAPRVAKRIAEQAKTAPGGLGGRAVPIKVPAEDWPG